MEEKATTKINWISILQGWSMLLVVIGHAGLSKIPRNPEEPIISTLEYIIYSFHMPLFMMISGHLFYLTRIRSSINYPQLLFDKLKRLGIPYIVFTGITLLLKSIFNEYMVRKTSFTLKEIVNAFLYPGNNPLGELWFIATLLLIFIFSPVFKWAVHTPFYCLIGCLFLCFLHFFPGNIELFCLNLVAQYAIWFFIGLLIGKYDWKNYLDKWSLFIILGGIFIVAFILSHNYGMKEIDFILTLAGCLFSYSLALKLDNFTPSLFHTFRDYTFQIYLMGIFFQIAFKLFYQRILYPHFYGIAFCVCVLLGIYLPVIISLSIQKIKVKYIDLVLGIKVKK